SRLYCSFSAPRADDRVSTSARALVTAVLARVGFMSRSPVRDITVSGGRRRTGPGPVLRPRTDVASHGASGRAGVPLPQRLDDREVLVRLLVQPAKIVAFLVTLPGNVAERAEQRLEPAELLGKEVVAARGGNQVVQPAIDSAGLLDEARPGGVAYTL